MLHTAAVPRLLHVAAGAPLSRRGPKTAGVPGMVKAHPRAGRLNASPNQNSSEGDSLNGDRQPSFEAQDLMSHLDVKEIAAKMLEKEPATQESIKRIQAARLRVAEAQAAREELQNAMQAKMFEARLQEVQQAQTIPAAEADAEVKMAQAALLQAQADSLEAASMEAKWREALTKEAEKSESVKAAVIAAAAGTAASLPLTATYSDDPAVAVLSTLTVAGSSFLLGVVYRYALRQDLGNSQLKGGVVAAFGLVRGLAITDTLQSEAGGQLTQELVAKGALLTGYSVLAFGFAAVALEFALQRGFLKAYGTAAIDVE
eukprot:jgi/Tetstr1/427258/TSEL_017443.t1